MDTYLQYLTAEHTAFGITFQNWVPLVLGIFIAWVVSLMIFGKLKSNT